MFLKKPIQFAAVIVIIVCLVFILNAVFVSAADVTNFTASLSSNGLGEQANYIIEFITPSGISAGQNFQLTFASQFNIGLVDYTDMDLEDDSLDLNLAATASGATWGASFSGQILTITSGTGSIAAGSVVTIEIGTNATHQIAGTRKITNPLIINSYLLQLGGTFGDSGRTIISIYQDDVGITAQVVPVSGSGGVADTLPPIISNIQVINITATSATVTWLTHEDSTSFVDYGLTDSYEMGTVSDGAFVTAHEIDLSDLAPGTTYHIQVRSLDSSGNEAISGDFTFTTAEVEGLFLYLRAVPEKRLPPIGNNSTILRVKIFDSASGELLLDETTTTDKDGYDSGISLEEVSLPGQFDFLVKGYSHLNYRKDNIVINSSGELVDLSEEETVFLKAGDVNGTDGDNYVNGLDLSILGNHIYTDDYRNDLNQDKLVNGLEFSIAVTNLYQWGDF